MKKQGKEKYKIQNKIISRLEEGEGKEGGGEGGGGEHRRL